MSFGEKISLMSSVLYKKQRKDDEKPIYDPDEFKKMLEREEPKLQGFFDELIASTNSQKKNFITNQQNKKKLVLMCYFLAGLNNKFTNSVKADVGFLLSASGTSTSAIETLANAQRQKHQLAESHQQTVGDYIIENVIFFCLCNILRCTIIDQFLFYKIFFFNFLTMFFFFYILILERVFNYFKY